MPLNMPPDGQRPEQPEQPDEHIPRAGLLRSGRFQSSGLPGAPAQQEQQARPTQPAQPPAQQASARQRLGELLGGSRPSAKPAGDVSGRPIKVPLLVRIGLMMVVLFIIWLVVIRPQAGQVPTSPVATPAAAQPSGQATPQPTSSPAAGATATAPAGQSTMSPPDQVAAKFLAAYFSWDLPDTNQTYVQRWSGLVVPEMLANLDGASPRHSLDGGHDSAAQSEAPSIDAGAVVIQEQSAQVTVTWTIQVLPQGGELATWQPRTIEATLSLTQTSTAWLIKTIAWSGSSS